MCCQYDKVPAMGFCENSAQLTAAGVTATYSGAINQAVSLGHARPVPLLHTPPALNFLPQKSVTQHVLSGRRQRIGLGGENFLVLKRTMHDIMTKCVFRNVSIVQNKSVFFCV